MPIIKPPNAIAGVSLSFLKVVTLWVATMRITKKITPMDMRPSAMIAPMESEPFKP